MPPRKSKPASPPPSTSLTPLVPLTPIERYKEHRARWAKGCGAAECGRARHVVFARGTIPAQVLFLGEGPGVSEDVLGKPFVGPAGELLQRIIDQAVPAHVTYALYNVVGCMPTDDDGTKSGEPSDEQVRSCMPKVMEFLEIADPDLLVCVGTVSDDWTDPKAHHRIPLHRDIPRLAIRHPAWMLRCTIATRGLEIQRCIVQLSQAVAKVDSEGSAR
jgi:uracil-DNA glycosylase family 4